MTGTPRLEICRDRRLRGGRRWATTVTSSEYRRQEAPHRGQGPGGRSRIWLEDNEFRATYNFSMNHWRHVVPDRAMSALQLFGVRDPSARLVANETARMRISAGDVSGGAEIDA